MKTSDFYFDLPEELIAQTPPEIRGQSRLFAYRRDNNQRIHSEISKLPEFLSPDTLIVMNNTRVRKARVYAQRESGAQVEFLFLHPLDENSEYLSQDMPSTKWEVMVTKAKRQKVGTRYRFAPDLEAEVIAEMGEGLRIICCSRPIGEEDFARLGHVPLPPYIRREDRHEDESRYQTVYADKSGSVAAPTAGLHITQDILQALEMKGIQRCEITLHVGLGTFLPVRVSQLEQHRMHREEFEIAPDVAATITAHKQSGKPVLAVGTTSVRTLESAWNRDTKTLRSGRSSTDIFMYPGYEFQVVDKLLTNFHTPESTLLMLVSAFAGKEHILDLYREAVEKRYRFFSYGDAMLIQ